MSDTQTLKNTALSELHTKLGAKMVPFAGFNMPVLYTNLIEEHNAVRNSVGIFDVSHMGEFHLKGERVLDLLQYITSNDVSKLFDGKVQYSCLPNNEGGIVDDLLVYRQNANEYYLVVNAGNIEKDWNWISDHNKNFGCEMHNISADYSLLAVQGPNAKKVLEKLTTEDLDMEYYTYKTGTMAGVENAIISCTGYTGAGGYEIYIYNKDAESVWNAIMEAGKEFDIKPCGLGARDTLRTEMGFCLYGHDIDDTTSPIEAGLGWITKFTKEFVMSDHHKKIKDNGPEKKLCGFEMTDRGIPRQHYEIQDEAGTRIGEVTSGTQSPTLGKAIGMGYVKTSFAKEGTDIFIVIRDKKLRAKVVKMPFLKK